MFQEFAVEESRQFPGALAEDLGPPITMDFGLHAAVAEQRPGPHDVIYLPVSTTPAAHRWKVKELGTDYKNLIFQPDPSEPCKYVLAKCK